MFVEVFLYMFIREVFIKSLFLVYVVFNRGREGRDIFDDLEI